MESTIYWLTMRNPISHRYFFFYSRNSPSTRIRRSLSRNFPEKKKAKEIFSLTGDCKEEGLAGDTLIKSIVNRPIREERQLERVCVSLYLFHHKNLGATWSQTNKEGGQDNMTRENNSDERYVRLTIRASSRLKYKLCNCARWFLYLVPTSSKRTQGYCGQWPHKVSSWLYKLEWALWERYRLTPTW